MSNELDDFKTHIDIILKTLHRIEDSIDKMLRKELKQNCINSDFPPQYKIEPRVEDKVEYSSIPFEGHKEL